MFMKLHEHQWYDESETQEVAVFKTLVIKGNISSTQMHL